MPLYRRDEIPEGMKGRGMWHWYGKERLFSTFSGDGNNAVNTDWECKDCGYKWYRNSIIKNHNAHCPRCGLWIGLKGLKFNGKQKNLEEF